MLYYLCVCRTHFSHRLSFRHSECICLSQYRFVCASGVSARSVPTSSCYHRPLSLLMHPDAMYICLLHHPNSEPALGFIKPSSNRTNFLSDFLIISVHPKWNHRRAKTALIYLLTAIGLTVGGSSTVHIYTKTIHRTTQWNNAQNTTYITISVSIKYKIYKIKQKHTKHTTIYTAIKNGTKKNMKECDKRKSHISSKLHMICISSNNVGHSVTKIFTTLHPTTLHFTTLVDTSLPLF